MVYSSVEMVHCKLIAKTSANNYSQLSNVSAAAIVKLTKAEVSLTNYFDKASSCCWNVTELWVSFEEVLAINLQCNCGAKIKNHQTVWAKFNTSERASTLRVLGDNTWDILSSLQWRRTSTFRWTLGSNSVSSCFLHTTNISNNTAPQIQISKWVNTTSIIRSKATLQLMYLCPKHMNLS